MQIIDLRPSWGSTVIFNNPRDFFRTSPEFWRNLVYRRKLIIFKKMEFSVEDYIEFCLRFGNLWLEDEYIFNQETAENIETKKGVFTLSPFSNKISNIAGGMGPMPWHADIANPETKKRPFCFRTLWITKNPNPENSGFTTWLEIENGIAYLKKDLLELIDRITIQQQSWLYPGELEGEYEFLKTHPITNRKSLRLNWFNDEETDGAYIKAIKLDGVLQENCDLLKEFFRHLERCSDLVYTHTWDTYDIALYDNWPLVHKRSRLNFDPDLERHFYRANIDHLNDIEWAAHKEKYFF